jgi:hypothetical protein
MRESILQDSIRLALGREPDLVLWRNNIGFDPERRVRYGVGGPGGADLIGIFRGRLVAVEIKTETGRQSAEQREFEQLVKRKGGVYVVLRSEQQALEWIEEMRRAYGRD